MAAFLCPRPWNIFLIATTLSLSNGASKMTKHDLPNECTETGLQSGSYQVLLPHDESFLIDCMVDGTMFINPGDQGLYHYRRQAGLKMTFKLLKAAQYQSLDDVDRDFKNALTAHNVISAADIAVEEEEGGLIVVGDVDDESAESAAGYDDEASGFEEQITEKGKKTVNMTAQYVVYSVIIIMAIAFSVGISLLIYMWCCRQRGHPMDTGNPIDGEAHSGKEDVSTLGTIDERIPFVDIRSPNTIERAKLNAQINAQTVSIRPRNGTEDENEELLRNQRSNVYDDINGADDAEDGDDMIAHYGSTTAAHPIAARNDGYVIGRNSL